MGCFERRTSTVWGDLPVSEQFTSNIQKGGALLDDTRRVVEVWDPGIGPEENLARIAGENLLAKASRARVDDVLLRIIRPRFVDPGPHLLPSLKGLLGDTRAFTEACYYETARDDQLLAAFAEGPLWSWWQDGRVRVDIAEVTAWLVKLAAAGATPAWSDSVRTKVARGLLSALRNFGILRGSLHKEFAHPNMSPTGFAYVAWREHEQGASSRALVASPVWSRWLLDTGRVLNLFGQAASLGVLRFSQAGSAVRIDWLVGRLEEVTGAAA
jgi:hypothetical protein